MLYITRKRVLLLNFSRYSEQRCRLVEAGYVLGFLLAVDVGRNIDYEHILLPMRWRYFSAMNSAPTSGSFV